MTGTKTKQLKNPPIQEALIDIRFETSQAVELVALEKFADKLNSKYPKKSPRIRFSVGIQVNANSNVAEKPVKQKYLQEGYVVTAENTKEAVQFTANNFTFNKLHPYSSWEEIKKDASVIWSDFSKEFQVSKVKRIALRYINKLQLDLPFKNGFEDFVKILPTIPEGLPQEIEHFSMQLIMPKKGENIKAIINQTFEKRSDKEAIDFILDIDAFNQSDVGIPLDSLWSEFEKIRNFKNDIFFLSTTDGIRNKYDK